MGQNTIHPGTKNLIAIVFNENRTRRISAGR